MSVDTEVWEKLQQQKRLLQSLAATLTVAQMPTDVVINTCAELFAFVVLNNLASEAQCHEVINSATESAHLYINHNWRHASEQRAEWLRDQQKALNP